MDAAPENLTRRFLPNLSMNAIAFILNVLIGLVLVPYFITELGGYGAYGIITMATSVTAYVTLIVSSLNTSVSRYLSISIQKCDHEDSDRTYNSSIYGILGLVLLILPFAVMIGFAAPYLFNTGSAASDSVQSLFILIFISVLISTWGNNFSTVLFANNRIDLKNLVTITQLSTQIALIILFFNLWEPRLESIGLAYLIASIISVSFAYILSRRQSPYLKIDRSKFDKDRFKEIGHVGGWNIINNVGNLLFIEMSKILANLLLGDVAGGEFASIALVVSMIVTLNAVLDVFAPITYSLYSNGRTEEMIKTCRSAIKVLGIFLALPVAFVCIFSPQILDVWLPGDVSHLSEPLFIMLFLIVPIESVVPIFPIGVAYLKVKIPALMTLLIGISNVVLAILFVEYLDLGLSGLALALAISTFSKNCFYTWYFGKITGVKGLPFFAPMFQGFFLYIGCLFLCAVLDSIIVVPASFFFIAILAIVMFAIYISLVPNILLNRWEKDLIRNCLPSMLESKLPRWFL